MSDQLWVTAIDAEGRTVDRFLINKRVQVAAESDDGAAPSGFTLEPNYPNPVADSATIPYTVAEPARVRLEVIDAAGRRLAVLVDRTHAPGRYTVTYDARRLPAGAYLLYLTDGARSRTRPMTVVR